MSPRHEGRVPLAAPAIAPGAAVRIAEVLASARLTHGPMVERFEAALQVELGALRPPVTTSSIGAAFELALELAEVGPGSIVITTPIASVGLNVALVRRGARLLWADVDPQTGTVDPVSVGRLAARHKVSTLVAVDWGGRACNYPALARVLAERRVRVIEDAREAWGASCRGLRLTDIGGDFVCYGFGEMAALSAGPEGGALVAHDGEADAQARCLRYFGVDAMSSAAPAERKLTALGLNAAPSDLGAAIGLANLDLARRVVTLQRSNARFYAHALANVPGVTLPPADKDAAWARYALRVDRETRRDLWEHLDQHGIEASPVELRNDEQPALRAAALNASESRPGVEAFAAEALCIPCGWQVGNVEQRRIVAAVRSWAAAESA